MNPINRTTTRYFRHTHTTLHLTRFLIYYRKLMTILLYQNERTNNIDLGQYITKPLFVKLNYYELKRCR
jgi:hypothetical protein